MTQNVGRSGLDLTGSDSAVPRRTSDRSGVWYHQRYAWLVVLLGVVVFNLLYALPTYLSFDQDRARIALDPSAHNLHYGFVVAHAVTGNVAMVTVLLQLWPWLRRNHPQVHRISGRVYILLGVLPSAGLALFTLLPMRQGQTGSEGLMTMGVLWLVTTGMGWLRARQHRYAEHQRWMIYSFALALGTSWGRVILEFLLAFPSIHPNVYWLLEYTSWLGWVINLLVAHLWIESRATRTSKGGAQIVKYPSPVR